MVRGKKSGEEKQMTARREAGARSCQAPGPAAGLGRDAAGALGPWRTAEAIQETPRSTGGWERGCLPRSNETVSVSGFFDLKICMLKTFLLINGVEKNV